MEKRLEKADKKFGFIEESHTQSETTATSKSTPQTRAEETKSRHEDAKFNRMAKQAEKYLKANPKK